MLFTKETQFKCKDIVWFMHENKPVQGIVGRINIEFEHYCLIDGYNVNTIFNRLKKYLYPVRRRVYTTYGVTIINNDGTKVGAHISHLQENNVFVTKEELLKSL